MKNKYIFTVSLFLMLFLSLSAVSAIDLNDTGNIELSCDKSLNIEDNNLKSDMSGQNDEKILADDSEILGEENDDGTFADLNNLIENSKNNIISLDKNYTYNKSTDSQFSSGIHISANLTINGNNYTINGLDEDSGEKARIFIVNENITLNLNNIILINGNSSDGGGTIFNNGIVNINNSTIAKSHSNIAGAIYNNGNLTVNNSNIVNNTANYASAIRNNCNLTIDNSNITHNNASANVGSIRNYGNAIISNSNLSYNNAEHAKAIYNDGNLTLNNNIINNTYADIYNMGNIKSEVNIIILENKTVDMALRETDTISAKITDDNGNLIYEKEFYFRLNSEKELNGTYNSNNSLYEYNYTADTEGWILVDAEYSEERIIKTGTINVSELYNYIDLQRLIDSTEDGGSLILNHSYSYDVIRDKNYSTGMFINKNITIIGNNHTISGEDNETGDNASIFFVNQNASLSLDNITLINSYYNLGGAIYNEGDLTINNTRFENNTANKGGAIYNKGNLIINNSLFDSNNIDIRTNDYANGGAAIYSSEGNLLINNTNFTDNLKNYTLSDYVGASIVAFSNTSIYNSNFINNSGRYGGAILSNGINGDNNLTVDNCTFINNTAFLGSAINIEGSAFSISNSTFENNTGYLYGAICIQFDENINYCPKGNISKSSFINNSLNPYHEAFKSENPENVSSKGGAIFNIGILNLTDSTFINNNATRGGAIFSYYNDIYAAYDLLLTVQNSSFINNSAVNNNGSSYGGAIYSYNVLDIKTSEFIENIADRGGAVYIHYIDADSNISHSNFKNNSANYGGAVYASSAKLNILESDLSNNSAKYGAAIYNTQKSILSLTDSNITNNKAINNSAIYNNAILNIDYSDISNNSARDGGAIYNSLNGTVTISNSRLSDNTVKRYGGAIYNNGVVNINSSYINYNNAKTRGGAIYNAAKGNSTITNSNLENNTSPTGIAIYNNNNLYLDNNIIDTETADIYNNKIINSTVIINVLNNQTKKAILRENTTLTINLTDDNGNLIYGGTIEFILDDEDETTLTGTYNNQTGLYEASYYVSSTKKVLVSGTYYKGTNLTIKTGLIKVIRLYNFIDLQRLIDLSEDGEELVLNHSYTYNASRDENYSSGIIINKTITIKSLNGNTTSIIGYDNKTDTNARIFTITETGNLTLNNITVKNAKSDIGGAIYNNGSLKADSINFINNTAEYGGAIYNSANMSISNSNFTNNTGSGESIYNEGNLTLNNNIINTSYAEIYNIGHIIPLTIIILNNETVYTDKNETCLLTGVVTDDNGNLIKGGNFTFIINDTLLNGSYNDINSYYEGRYVFNTTGEYPISGNYTSDEITVKTGSVIVLKINSNLSISTKNITIGEDENIKINIEEDATGSVKLILTSDNYSYIKEVNLSDTKEVSIPNLPSGNYTAFGIYSGDRNYNIELVNDTFSIAKINSFIILNINSSEINYGDRVNISINLYDDESESIKDATGNVTLTITYEDGNIETITADADDLREGIILSRLNAGNILISAIYNGDSKYTESDKYNTSITVNKVEIKPEIAIFKNKDNKSINANVTLPSDVRGNISYIILDENNITIATGNGSDLINGTSIVRSDDLNPGNYTIAIIYSGDENYIKSNKTKEFEIPKESSYLKVFADNIIYGENATINIKLLDDEDNPIEGSSEVTISINNTDYTVNITDGIGTLIVNNLTVGNYSIISKFNGNSYYEATESEEVILTVTKTNSNFGELSINVEDTEYGEDAIVNISLTDINGEKSNGTVKVNVNATEFKVTVIDGKGAISISNLPGGSYTIAANYDNDNYETLFANTTFTVNPSKEINLTIKTENITYGEDIIINLSLTGINDDNLDGIVSIRLNNNSYYISVINGTSSLAIPKLNANNYTIEAEFIGDRNYTSSSRNSTFTVSKDNNVSLSINTKDIIYGSDAVIYIELTGSNSRISDRISVKVNETVYNATITNGKGSLTISNLKAGNYTITASFPSNSNYASANATSSIEVSPQDNAIINITATPITYGENATIQVSITDANGNNLSGTVILTIDNTTYTLRVNGTSTISIPNLSGGYHTVTANFTDPNYNTPLAVTSQTVEKLNTTLIYKNMTTYVVPSGERNGEWFNATLTDTNGEVLANKTVKIGFNGNVYTRTTNSTGGVQLQINIGYQSANTFAITFLSDENYTGFMGVAIIVVYPLNTTLKVAKPTYTYKSNAKTKTVKATLTLRNGTAIAGKTITLKINNRTYTANTNSKGIVTIKIAITSKGNYSGTLSFAGNNQYAKATSTVTVKIS